MIFFEINLIFSNHLEAITTLQKPISFQGYKVSALNGVQNWILINDLALLVLHKSGAGGQYGQKDIGSL